MPGTSAPDDLTTIKGVGEATATWLAETFGVRSARGLAGLDVATVEAGLAASRRPGVSRSTIDGWIEQARALSDPSGAPGKGSGWRPVASFVVEFQARDDAPDEPTAGRVSVHHLEDDHTEIIDSAERGPLCDWMFGRLPAPGLPDPSPAVPPATGSAGDDPHSCRTAPVAVVLHAGVGNDARDRTGLPVDLNSPWTVAFHWSVDDRRLPPPGEWTLDVVLERVGSPGRPLRPRPEALRIPSHPGAGPYRVLFPVAAGALPFDAVDAVLRGTATLTFRPDAARHPVLAAFADLGVVPVWVSGGSGGPDGSPGSAGTGGPAPSRTGT